MNDLRQKEVPYSAAPAPQGGNFDQPEAARRPRREDAQVRRRLEPGLRRRRHDRQHPRRRHRLGASRPPEHVADVVGRDGQHLHRRRLERLAEGLRPVRHAGLAPRPGLRRPGAHLVHADDGEELVQPELSGQEGESSARQLRDARRPVAQLQRAGRDGLALLHVPEGLDEVRDRPHGEPSGRPSAPALRRAPCDPRHRPEHGGRLRHGLRRPRRRLPVRRREAGHEGLAGVVPRHERRRLQRPLGRPSLLHLRRRDGSAGRHHALHGRLAGVP